MPGGCVQPPGIASPTIMGNYDQVVGTNSEARGCVYTSKEAEALGKHSIAWTNQHTSAGNKLFLQQPSAQIPRELNGLRVLLVHGSPRKISEYLYDDRPDVTIVGLLDLA